jgi:hypothetical protein
MTKCWMISSKWSRIESFQYRCGNPATIKVIRY